MGTERALTPLRDFLAYVLGFFTPAGDEGTRWLITVSLSNV
jgi:hypothetical protein